MNESRSIEASEHSLAYELLVEVKQSARRWFIAFCFMLLLEIITIAGFMWYISLPQEETSQSQQTIEDVEMTQDNDVRQIIGD